MLNYFLKDYRERREAEQALADRQLKNEIRLKYVIPQMTIPIDLQLAYSKLIVECCLEEGEPVPEVAQRKSNLLKKISNFSGILYLSFFATVIYYLLASSHNYNQKSGPFEMIFSLTTFYILLSAVLFILLLAGINALIINQFDNKIKFESNTHLK
jgi:hypothetical protein